MIIVGATHSATSHYRDIADSVYAEAIQYSTNVTRIYSPNATWAAVKPALQGANVVVYLGHGNGWPSPYTYDPAYTTKDGLGLNATANAGDNNTKYYGEPSLANEIHLAPNAVVLLEPPLLRVGQLRAGLRGSHPERGEAAGGQLWRRVHQGRRTARSSPKATAASTA